MKPDRPMIEQLKSEPDSGSPPAEHGPRSIHSHVTRPIVQQLVKVQAHKVLEMGCGNGWFTGALDRCGFEVTGVDHRAARVRVAEQQWPHLRFECVDVMQPLHPSLTGRFDAVVAVELIDHMPLPRRLIEAALCALKPGGLLVITSNFHGYSKNLALALTGRFDSRWTPLSDEGRVKFFSRATLISLLSEFELLDLHFETVGRIPMFARTMLVAARKPA